MTLTADDREPRSRIEAVRAVIPDLSVRRLKAGDWQLETDDHSEAWEVKTVGSLQASVVNAHTDGRSILEAELAALVSAYEHRRLVVIGSAWPSSTARLHHDRMAEAQKEAAGWPYATYLRILDSAADHGVPVIQLPGDYAFALWAAARHRAFTTQHTARPIKHKAVFAYRPAEVGPLLVLAALPGIGPATARAWWRGAGTVRSAIAQGIDGARRQAVDAVLDMPYEAELMTKEGVHDSETT